MLLCELYQEEKSSSFTHDGKKYNLNKVLQAMDDHEATDIQVDKLKWILDDSADPDRVDNADLDVPILITRWEDKWATIDGFHRLTKAVKEKVDVMPAKKVSKAILKDALIEDKS